MKINTQLTIITVECITIATNGAKAYQQLVRVVATDDSEQNLYLKQETLSVKGYLK